MTKVWILGYPKKYREDSDQTARMRKLSKLAGHTPQKYVFCRCDSVQKHVEGNGNTSKGYN